MIADTTWIVCDTETSGTDPAEHELLEVAAVATGPDVVLGMLSHLVVPTKPISPCASGINGLTASMLVDGLPANRARGELLAFIERFPNPVLVAHNAAFDQSFLGFTSVPTLCTYRLAMKLWPGNPYDYKLGTLRDWRGLKVETYGIPAHRALGDSLTAAALLRDQLSCEEFGHLDDFTQVEDLIEFAEAPMILQRWPNFGKHKGEPIDRIPDGYLQWCVGPKGLDLDDPQNRDLRATIFHETKRRRGVAA